MGLDFPTASEQDLNAPAVAEYTFGQYRGAPRLMTVSIGTGLGAGLVLNGQVLRFLSARPAIPDISSSSTAGRPARRAARGCAEALISGPGVERLAAERGAGRLSAREIITAARLGEPWAASLFDSIGSWLGQWLASLAPIFLPSHVILCGGVSEAREALLRPAERRLHELAGPDYARCLLDIQPVLGVLRDWSARQHRFL